MPTSETNKLAARPDRHNGLRRTISQSLEEGEQPKSKSKYTSRDKMGLLAVLSLLILLLLLLRGPRTLLGTVSYELLKTTGNEITVFLAGIIVTLAFTHLTSKQRKRDAALNQTSTLLSRSGARAVREILGTVPNWITEPDIESVSWLNKLFKQRLWYYISVFAQDSLRESVEKPLQTDPPAMIRRIKFKEFHLGQDPPTITGVRFIERTRTNMAHLELGILYRGDPRLVLDVMTKAGLGVEVSIDRFVFRGTLRVILGPLLGNSFLFASSSITLMQPPEVSFSLQMRVATQIGIRTSKVAIPGLSTVISSYIKETIGEMMVFPNAIKVPNAHVMELIDKTTGKKKIIHSIEEAGVVKNYSAGRETDEQAFAPLGILTILSLELHDVEDPNNVEARLTLSGMNAKEATEVKLFEVEKGSMVPRDEICDGRKGILKNFVVCGPLQKISIEFYRKKFGIGGSSSMVKIVPKLKPKHLNPLNCFSPPPAAEKMATEDDRDLNRLDTAKGGLMWNKDRVGLIQFTVSDMPADGHLQQMIRGLHGKRGKSTIWCAWRPLLSQAHKAARQMRDSMNKHPYSAGGMLSSDYLLSELASIGVLSIDVRRGIDLMAADLNGTSDPYVVVLVLLPGMDPIERKTKPQSQTLNPEFAERFDFPIPDADEADIIVEVFDEDYLGQDDSLGKYSISLHRLKSREGQIVQGPQPLENASTGSIDIRIQWMPVKDLVEQGTEAFNESFQRMKEVRETSRQKWKSLVAEEQSTWDKMTNRHARRHSLLSK